MLVIDTPDKKLDPSECLVPPKRYLRQAHHHWLQALDGDGRAIFAPFVMQWQPAVGNWCHSGQAATGSGIELRRKDTVYLCACDMPDIENDLTVLGDPDFRQKVTQMRMRLNREGASKFTIEDISIIQELCKMHGNPI